MNDGGVIVDGRGIGHGKAERAKERMVKPKAHENAERFRAKRKFVEVSGRGQRRVEGQNSPEVEPEKGRKAAELRAEGDVGESQFKNIMASPMVQSAPVGLDTE